MPRRYGVVNPWQNIRGAPFCGPDCEDVVLTMFKLQLLSWSTWFLLLPTVPRLSKWRLKKAGLDNCEVRRVPLLDREKFLVNVFVNHQIALLWVKRRWWSHCANHVIVVTILETLTLDNGWDKREYYIVDPENNITWARDEKLLAGNRKVSEAELMRMWRFGIWRKWAWALITPPVPHHEYDI